MNTTAIAIPCYNSGITLPSTLESLIQSDCLYGSTIVLLDGGSTDFTRAIFESFDNRVQGFHFIFRDFSGLHPAQRLNALINEQDYEYIFLCHSDDIYNPAAMIDMQKYLEASQLWAVGSQCNFFLDPIDAIAQNSLPYVGSHLTHPQDAQTVYCEMALWWAISWNSVLLRAQEIYSAKISLDHLEFSFCNDYRFNWELAKRGKISNLPYCSVMTRHRSTGDGPQNLNALGNESFRIKKMIQEEIGLSPFLGIHLSRVLNSIGYAYGNWDIGNLCYPRSHYLTLASKLQEFSTKCERLRHFRRLGENLASVL